MIRYQQEEILPDLPPFTRQTTLLELTNAERAEYEKLQEDFCRWMLEKYPDRRIPTGDALVLTQFGYAKRRVAEFKVKAILEQIEMFLSGTDSKLLIFGIHKKILQAVLDVYSKKNTKTNPFIVGIDGSTNAVQRQQAVYNFNENPYTRLFLGQMVAAGTGLNLQKNCHHSLFMEVDWSPHIHEQCEARNRRIGTTANHVNYNYLIYRDTIEEVVCKMLFTKKNIFNQVIDGKSEHDTSVQFNLVQNLIRATMDRFARTKG